MSRPSRAFLALPVAACLAGCVGLLPMSSTEVRSPWHSFEQARDAIEAISPGRTTSADLRTMGLEPYGNPNVQLLNYSDIQLRFPTNVAPGLLDRGLRDCLEAGKACVGYYVNVREMKRDRVSGFWEDTLGFRRAVEVTGWSFNAIVLVVNDRAVYSLYGGQPSVRELEVSRQPLGPLQGFGESLPLGSLFK